MSSKRLLARSATVLALSTGLALAVASPAQAEWWRGGGWHGGGWHGGGWHGGGYGWHGGWGAGWHGGWGPGWRGGWGPGWGWRGGVYVAPPPVYVAPPLYAAPRIYYAPPPVYVGPPVIGGASPYDPAGGASGYGQHPQ